MACYYVRVCGVFLSDNILLHAYKTHCDNGSETEHNLYSYGQKHILRKYADAWLTHCKRKNEC